MIESIQKFASRVCLKQWSRDARYQDMLEILNMPSLAAHWRQRKLCTLYKVVNNNLSEYPSPLLIPRDPYFSSCSVPCLSFVRPYAHTNQYFVFPPHILFPQGIISLTMQLALFLLVLLNVLFRRYAIVLAQSCLCIPCLYCLQKHFRKKKC